MKGIVGNKKDGVEVWKIRGREMRGRMGNKKYGRGVKDKGEERWREEWEIRRMVEV